MTYTTLRYIHLYCNSYGITREWLVQQYDLQGHGCYSSTFDSILSLSSSVEYLQFMFVQILYGSFPLLKASYSSLNLICEASIVKCLNYFFNNLFVSCPQYSEIDTQYCTLMLFILSCSVRVWVSWCVTICLVAVCVTRRPASGTGYLMSPTLSPQMAPHMSSWSLVSWNTLLSYSGTSTS